MNALKSLVELRDELIGVRLQATNVSLWYRGATLSEAARTALNEALRTYEFTIQRTYHSLSLPAIGQGLAVLPKDVYRVVEVYALANTTEGPRARLSGYEFRATSETNFLWINARTFPGVRNAEVVYESRTLNLPPEVVLAATLSTLGQSVQVTGGIPAVQWRAPGYFQMRSASGSLHTELVRFEAVTPTHFTGLRREIEGLAIEWQIGDTITPVLEVPESALPVLMAAAQAEMYHYWIRNRALYEEYTAIASLQQLSLADLVGLVASEEARADRRWKRVRKPPEPTHVTTKRRRS